MHQVQVSTQQGTRDTISLGAVTLGSNLTTSIDAFLADSNSDKYIGTLSGDKNVIINSIKARSDSSNIYTKVKVAESGLRNNFALSEDILTLDSTGLSGTYKAQYLSSTGELVIAKDVHNFVLSAKK